MSDGNTKYEKIEESAHDSGFTYEHFPVVCPTCEGTGEIYEGTYLNFRKFFAKISSRENYWETYYSTNLLKLIPAKFVIFSFSKNDLH